MAMEGVSYVFHLAGEAVSSRHWSYVKLCQPCLCMV